MRLTAFKERRSGWLQQSEPPSRSERITGKKLKQRIGLPRMRNAKAGLVSDANFMVQCVDGLVQKNDCELSARQGWVELNAAALKISLAKHT